MILKIRTRVFIFIGIFLLMAGCTADKETRQPSQSGTKATESNIAEAFKMIPAGPQQVVQIQGLGYPGNDSALYAATNHGIKFYKGSKWLETSTNQHNYTSFQAVKNGFLASGHPGKGAGLKDPLGLVESVDKGESLKTLAFYGTSIFHFLSADFSDRDIYLIQEKPDAKLNAGVYYSNDSGKHWKRGQFKNFTANSLGMMAVHPQQGNIMAMATRSGIFYSTDHGNTMKQITGPVMITAQTFWGDDLLYSSVENQKILLKTINPDTGKQADVVFPFLDYDNPVTYITVDPKNKNNIAFSTYKNDLYESTDGGKSWNDLIENGKLGQE